MEVFSCRSFHLRFLTSDVKFMSVCYFNNFLDLFSFIIFLYTGYPKDWIRLFGQLVKLQFSTSFPLHFLNTDHSNWRTWWTKNIWDHCCTYNAPRCSFYPFLEKYDDLNFKLAKLIFALKPSTPLFVSQPFQRLLLVSYSKQKSNMIITKKYICHSAISIKAKKVLVWLILVALKRVHSHKVD